MKKMIKVSCEKQTMGSVARRLVRRGWLVAALVTGVAALEDSVSATEVPVWRIVPPSKVEEMEIALPPLAAVANRDDSGKTWRLSGTIAGSPALARQDFSVALDQQGWRMAKVIPLSRDRREAHLSLWKKNGQSIILMLWENGAGKTGFSVGLDK